MKKTKAKLTGLWLRPVDVHRTRLVVILEELDLSGIDRTLGGSVRSLPPERPVSGSRASSGLFLVSFSIAFGGLLNRTTAKKILDPVATLPPSPSLRRRHLATVAERAAVLLARRAAVSPRAPVPPVFQGHQVSSCPSPTSFIVGKTKFFNLDLL